MKCLRDLACAFALVVTSSWQVGATAAEWDVAALMSRLGERNSGQAEFSEKNRSWCARVQTLSINSRR